MPKEELFMKNDNDMTIEEMHAEIAHASKVGRFCDIGSWVALVISGLLNILQICFIPDGSWLKWCFIIAAGNFLICAIVMIIVEMRADRKARRLLYQLTRKVSVLIRIDSCPD